MYYSIRKQCHGRFKENLYIIRLETYSLTIHDRSVLAVSFRSSVPSDLEWTHIQENCKATKVFGKYGSCEFTQLMMWQ